VDFTSFKDLVQYHDDVTSPLRELPISNGYIVITREQKIPFSHQTFFKLLQRTKLKGMRMIFDLTSDGDIRAVDSHFELYSIAVKRNGNELKFIWFQPEYYLGEYGERPHLLTLTKGDRHAISTTFATYEQDVLSKYRVNVFNEDYDFRQKGVRFLDEERKNLFQLVCDTIDSKENRCYLPDLDNNGEYRHYKRRGLTETPYMKIYSIEKGKVRVEAEVSINDRDEPRELIETERLFLYYISDYDDYSSLHSFEEKASYLAYHSDPNWDTLKRRYKKIAKLFGLYTGFTHFWTLQNVKHSCINTGNTILCLVAEVAVQNTKDFTVLERRKVGDLYLHSIRLK
jgi:hypothetical protein